MNTTIERSKIELPNGFTVSKHLGSQSPLAQMWDRLALLQHSFGEFYRRGTRKIGLGVDAENLTGALRLYEKAGMHIHLAFDLFEKTVRSGREISVESL